MHTVTNIRPVVNITHKAPGQRPAKFARITFPEGSCAARIMATLARFPETEGYHCDLRQIGPLGFSLPLDLAGA